MIVKQNITRFAASVRSLMSWLTLMRFRNAVRAFLADMTRKATKSTEF